MKGNFLKKSHLIEKIKPAKPKWPYDYTQPLWQALEKSFWSWVKQIEGKLENKGKPLGENISYVPHCECECCIKPKILGW